MFAGHYSSLMVSIRSAELVEGEGIVIRGLKIVEPGTKGPLAEVIHLDEVLLVCQTDLQHLVAGDPSVSRVVVRRPTLRVTCRPDGSWSAARLLPLPRFNARPPVVTIENGTVEISDPQRIPPSTYTLRDINLTMAPLDAPQPAPRSQPPNGQGPAEPGHAAAAPEQESHVRSLKMTLTGDHLRRMEVEGRIDLHAMECVLKGSIENLEISPEFRDALPEEFAERLAVLGALRGEATLTFDVDHRDATGEPTKFEVSGRLSRGRLNDPRLPYPLTDVRAFFRLNNDGMTIDNLFARNGQSTVRLSCRRSGHGAKSPLALDVEVRHLDLNRGLLDIPGMPDALRDQWDRYRPFGQIHADLKVEYDGRTWHPEASVQCLDVSFTHHKFPYRLDHGRGSLELKNDVLKLNLEAYGGTQPIRLAAEVLRPGPGWTGWFEAKGDDLPLDKKLFDALNDQSHRVVASLNPNGTVGFLFRMWVDEPGQPPHKQIVIGLNRCTMCYERFPYPLANIRGTLEGQDGRWTFRDLEGTSDSARVTCEGHLLPISESAAAAAGVPPSEDQSAAKELLLRMTVADLALDEKLRDALAANVQRLWNDLQPQGRVDLKDLEVRHVTGQRQAGVTFRAEPRGDTASIEPVYFPYRLEKLHGAMVFGNGHVQLENLRAEHGHVNLSAGGTCDFGPDGNWHLVLDGISVDRLRLDRELIKIMPEQMKRAFTTLNAEGPVDLRGRWEFQRGGSPDDPLRSAWNLDVSFAGTSIQNGIKLENLHGGVTLIGGFDGRDFHSYGELAVDSATYRDLQFTQVTGPLWIDGRQVLFGSYADRQRNEYDAVTLDGAIRPAPRRRLRPVTGRIFNGTVYGNAWIALGTEPQYGLRATLADADLGRIAQELIPGQQNLRGKIVATLDLRGTGRSVNTLAGQGNVHVRDADLYELPVMIALLKVLNLRRPDTNAFSAGDVNYRIAGSHIYFDRLVFNGDAISLEGNGEADFQGDIAMNFHPVLGREDRKVVVLKELLGGAGQEFMLIRVSGTLQDPRTEKEVFPTVNQALQQLTVGSQGLLPLDAENTPSAPRKLPLKRF
jgi:hypothetical protein